MHILTNYEVRIFSRMDRTNWSIRALLYSRNQHLGLTRQNDTLLNYNDNLHIKFLLEYFHSNSSGTFSSSSASFKEKLSFKKTKTCLKSLYRPLCLFIDVGLRFSGPIRLFGGPIRLWTDR